MKNKQKVLLSFFTLMLTIFSISATVMADDDDDEYEHERQEHYEEYDDGDQDWQPLQQLNPSQNEYWYIWSRETRNNPNNTLPVTKPSEIKLNVNNAETTIYCIPQEGQLLVSAKKFAEVIGARSIYYPQSKISLLSNGTHELIVKGGSNAAYENKVKTPMPVAAVSYEKTIYLPISVAANALGYRITWDELKGTTIVLKSF